MEDRLARLEDRVSDLIEQSATTAQKVDDVLHWIHNGGNPKGTEVRIRHLEQWRSFMAGVVALASIVFTVALVVLGGR